MKFEHKFPAAQLGEQHEFQYSFVFKKSGLGTCKRCGTFAKWFDKLFQVHVCSEECGDALWEQYRNDSERDKTYNNFDVHFDHVKDELKAAVAVGEVWKDIIVVVRDQLDYLKICVESLKETTKFYHLYIWDNGSRPETAEYIQSLFASHDPEQDPSWDITIMRSEHNTGFIYPNNELAGWGTSPYIILLNSDTQVFDHWDAAMIGYLQGHADVAQVGYRGGHLDWDGRGFGGASGDEVDYIPGWCFCISRDTYNQFGLFDPALQFAYFEDADFSLRLIEAGKKIYALHSPLVHHFQNKTIKTVKTEGDFDVAASFEHNQKLFCARWNDYLKNHRVVVRQRKDSHG